MIEIAFFTLRLMNASVVADCFQRFTNENRKRQRRIKFALGCLSINLVYGDRNFVAKRHWLWINQRRPVSSNFVRINSVIKKRRIARFAYTEVR